MIQEHFDQWCALLTSGEIPQADGALVQDDGNGVPSMCCLGVGLKAMGVQYVSSASEEGFPTRSDSGKEIQNSLPSWDFLVWLGLMEQERADTLIHRGTLVGDVEILFTDFEVFAEGQESNPDWLHPISSTDWVTCAGMNDNGFTFQQIADCMRYFGIKAHE